MQALDPSAKAELSGYFNRSYVPDVMVAWKDGRNVAARPIFLRHSLHSSRASGDLDHFQQVDQTAFFLSLAQDDPEEDTQIVSEAATQHAESRALVTTVPALDELDRGSEQPDPVLDLVRSSVVRSAKGARSWRS